MFPLFLWTEVQPVHTPVRTQAYGPALSQSNVSILSVFCLVYNNDTVYVDRRDDLHFLLQQSLMICISFYQQSLTLLPSQ